MAARRFFLRRRRNVSAALRRSAATAVSRCLRPLLPRIAWLLAYQPLGSELSVTALSEEAHTLGLRVIAPGQHDDPSEVAGGLQGSWREPRVPLALLPGVAFDLRGTRLGRGAGFYDRLLAELPPRVVRVGVGFCCQLSSHLARDAHDVPVDAVLTESGLQLCGDCRPAAAAWLGATGYARPARAIVAE